MSRVQEQFGVRVIKRDEDRINSALDAYIAMRDQYLAVSAYAYELERELDRAYAEIDELAK